MSTIELPTDHSAGTWFGGFLARLKHIDWRRPDVKDGVILAAFAALVYVVAARFDLPPKLFAFALAHADWEVDDLLFVFVALTVALLVYVNPPAPGSEERTRRPPRRATSVTAKETGARHRH